MEMRREKLWESDHLGFAKALVRRSGKKMADVGEEIEGAKNTGKTFKNSVMSISIDSRTIFRISFS